MARGEIRLAGEPIAFDAELQPLFTTRQLRGSAQPSRDGLAMWARTGTGRRLIARFQSAEYVITVTEDVTEGGAGRAPDPGLGMLIAAGQRSRVKAYEIILNPSFELPKGMTPFPDQPVSAAEMMAVIWAGEMLHVDFYSRGISLPHHGRRDFQEEWRVVAGELGFPNLTHSIGDEPAYQPRRRRRR